MSSVTSWTVGTSGQETPCPHAKHPVPASRAARPLSLVLVASALAWVGASAPAEAAPPSCLKRTNNTYEKLLECVTLDGVRAHQTAFQQIADANDDEFYPGSRVAGTEGYAESVEYVAGKLREGRVRRDARPVRLPVRLPGAAASAQPRLGRLRDRDLHRLGRRRHHRQRHPGRPQPRTAAGEHERLRGRRLRRARLLRCQRHRADPARHLRRSAIKAVERRGRGRRSRHHLQRRQHPRP